MKRLFIVLALLGSPLFAQLNPNIIIQNADPSRQPDFLRSMEQAQRIRLMREQERMMAAQREAFARNLVEENYRKGFEEGLKKGFDEGKESTLNDYRANFPMIEQTVIRNMANTVFTTNNPDDFRTLIAQAETALKEDPGDNVKKVFLILFKHRLAELQPPPPPPPIKKKVKSK